MIRCYITDRLSCGGDVLPFARQAIRDEVDYIQIREKDLNARSLLELARAAVSAAAGSRTKILINGRADVAIAAGAHGIHLPSESPPPSLFHPLLVTVACHTVEEVRRAAKEGATFALFSPVFASPGKGPAAGLRALAEACAGSPVPVLALGGVTYGNAPDCLAAGAAGIAGVRLFQGPRKD